MGLIAMEQKDPAISQGYLDLALAIARQTRDRRLELKTLANLGVFAGVVMQDYGAAREYYEESYALNRETGDRSQEGIVLGNLGWAAAMQGDIQSARSYHERALLISREIANLYMEAYTSINLSALTVITNESDAAREYTERALELCRQSGDRSGEAWALLYMGYAALLFGDIQKAEESFKQSIAIREELEQPSMRIESLAGLIQTLLRKADYIGTLREVDTIISYLLNGDKLEGAEEPLRVYYACYMALEKMKDPRSLTVLDEAVQLLEAQVSKLRDEESRQRYIQNVPWRFSIQQAWFEKSVSLKDRNP
jgi:tetratricopeptide (TPR) repeat protein